MQRVALFCVEFEGVLLIHAKGGYKMFFTEYGAEKSEKNLQLLETIMCTY